ncbi:MAG: type II secretion system protein [Caldimonas sp.]
MTTGPIEAGLRYGAAVSSLETNDIVLPKSGRIDATDVRKTCLHARSSNRGFTLPELVAVLLLVGILSATAVPKLQGVLTFRDDGWRDQLVAALHYAHKSAISHRRLVCADVASAGVTLTIASANPASACGTVLPGLDGRSLVADAKGGAAAGISPAGTIYFQPSGRVTSDPAGVTASTRTISIAGQPAVVLVGETGHVE